MNSKKKRIEMGGVLSSFISNPIDNEENTTKIEPILEAKKQPEEDKKIPLQVIENNLVQLSVKTEHEVLEKLRDLAFWQRQTLQDVVLEAFEKHLSKFTQEDLKKAKEERLKQKNKY